MIKEDTIKTVVKRLVEAYSPVGIYLFGSYAWGEPNEDSDIDLLIIVKESEEKPHRRAIKGLKLLRDLRIPKDLIVSTKKEFETYSSNESNFFYKIKEEGKKLYELA